MGEEVKNRMKETNVREEPKIEARVTRRRLTECAIRDVLD